MHRRIRGRRLACRLLLAAVAMVAVTACGSSSGGGTSASANKLLKQTFTGSHTVTSGNISLSLTLTPSGSSTLKGPVTLSFGGPFQTRGKGKLPESNFNVTLSSQGKSGSVGILSTGTSGYVTLQGNSYQLPAATFQKLESSFSQIGASPGGGPGTGTLAKLGISPLKWLVNPSVVGGESVAGAQTTHIRAGVNVAALLGDLNTILQKASSLSASSTTPIPSSISQATRNRIASEVKNPTFDVWTGNDDKTLRKLHISVTVPVSGQISTLLGGLSTAGIGLDVQYADLNQPQTIAAPTSVRPFSQFATKLQGFVQALQSTLSGGLAGTAGGSSTTGSSGSGSPSGVTSYSQCIQAAGGDVTKMQRCASLLGTQ